MAALIDEASASRTRRSSRSRSPSPKTLLYRRGNFNGSFDQLILDALMAEKDAPIAFSPGLPLGHDAAARASRSAAST